MKKLWLKTQLFFISLFGSEKKLEKFIDTHVDQAIDIASAVKKIVENPTLTFIVALTKTKADDLALKTAIAVLDKVIAKLVMTQDCMAKPTLDEKVKCFAAQLRLMTPDAQEGQLLKIATLTAKLSSGVEHRNSVIDANVQMRFLERQLANQL